MELSPDFITVCEIFVSDLRHNRKREEISAKKGKFSVTGNSVPTGKKSPSIPITVTAQNFEFYFFCPSDKAIGTKWEDEVSQ